MATCIWGGPGALVSHRAAAALWKFDECPAGIVEVSMPSARHSPRSDIVVHKVLPFAQADIGTVDAIPVTGPTRTLLDLAAVVDHDRLELALESALRRRMTSVPRMKWALRLIGRPGRKGVGVMKTLLDIRGEGAQPTDSALETKALQALRGSGMPPPVRQHPLKGASRKRYLDLAYPHAKFFIEVQSYERHSGPTPWARDQTRFNELTVLGWRGIVVTAEDLRHHRAEFIEKVAKVLGLKLF